MLAIVLTPSLPWVIYGALLRFVTFPVFLGGIPNPPIFKAPTEPPGRWAGTAGLESLKTHLQTAIILELHTIPIYLYAAYSIKNNALAAYKIVNVVKQEMLHMALAGNCLAAIGGQPHVYGEKFTPVYPVLLFYDKIPLHLRPATQQNIETFKRIERPTPPPRDLRLLQTLLPGYESIGEFYNEILRGFKELYKDMGPKLFLSSSVARQYQTADGSWYDDDMQAIHSIESAIAALTTIIEQGEGTPAASPSLKNTTQSHYEVFYGLLTSESGLDFYDVVEDPKTPIYAGQPAIYSIMILSDAAYSYLLLTTEAAWRYAGPLRQQLVTNNIMNIMLTVLKPLSFHLVTQTLADGKHAASPFNLYKFKSMASAHSTLRELAQKAVDLNPNVLELHVVKDRIGNLIDLSLLNLPEIGDT